MLDIRIDRANMLPLYFQLKEELIRLIRSGILRPGDLLPTELELCQQLELSRGTVRQAVSGLAEQGFVVKERGRGTYVKIPTMNHDLLGEFSLGRGIQKIGMEVHSTVLRAEVLVPRVSIAKRLGIGRSDPVFNLLRLRHGDMEPWIYENTFLPYERFPGIDRQDFSEVLLSDFLATEYGVIMASINAFVEPIVLNGEYAESLEVAPGVPALVMDRVISDINGLPILYGHAVVRGDRCRYYFKING